MSTDPKQEATERAHRFREACALQEIEGNPLTPEEIAMFERFECEGWSDEKIGAFLLERAKKRSSDIAAE
jgi:hypothetical protein